MKERLKHYDLIIAWASGDQIQMYDYLTENWKDIDEPRWNANLQYRIKPAPKPDVTRNVVCEYIDNLKVVVRIPEHFELPNLRVTFDGETDRLKTALVLGHEHFSARP